MVWQHHRSQAARDNPVKMKPAWVSIGNRERPDLFAPPELLTVPPPSPLQLYY